VKLTLLAIALLVLPASLAAQTPPLPDMPTIARALGVECSFCHVNRGGGAETPVVGKPKIEIAKEMIAMTRDLNATIQAATGKAATEATTVQCVTCHRGVAIPRQLSDIIIRTAVEKGGPAAAAQYKELRERYYGRQAYDFSETELLRVAERLAESRPDAAIALLETNLEFNPQSSRTYQILAHAYTRKRDDATAIVHLEKALELDPTNAMARGQLEQLKAYQRRR
jgi:tetratricopeptide (TPR) repeat protein